MRKADSLYVGALLLLLASEITEAQATGNFLPFGNGDTNTPISDDGGSSAIILQHPFKYFGRTHSQVFVNNDGHLTFTQSLSSYVPYVNVRKDIIFPLWTDIDVRSGGTISYREDTSSAVLAQVTAAVRQQFPNLPFVATSAFVVTWHRVPYYSGEGVVTFQVVLAYNAHRSFILFNYGDCASTGQRWSAGYDTVDSASSFRLSVSSPSELSSSSNINMNGRWIFHVDGSPDLPNFLPFGNGDTNTPISDDGGSSAIILQHPFKYFGRTHSQVFVNNDGHLTFTQSLSSYVPYVNVRKDIIFPLWTDIDVRSGGTISYRQDTSSAVLAQVTAAVRQQFPNLPFIATSAFVVTWDNVPYYSGEGVVSFQVVLAYNAHRSFILFNYGDCAPTRQIWSAGYDTVDSASSFRLSVSSPSELLSSSNINMNGHWIFHVDGSPDLPNFLPFGNGDTNTPISDDGGSSAIILQHPFKYFGRTHSQVFVNNDGHLTFTQSLSSYIPYLNVRKDIIFPLWTDIDVRSGGTISYREDTSSAVLAQVTAAVRQQFPNLPFVATSAFVVTWDNVPYYSGEGVVSFQVVLAYNAHRSFILFNYGDSAPTRQIWSAGYDTVDSASSFRLSVSSPSELLSSSNINMNGHWIFHVDGSPDLPTIFLVRYSGERSYKADLKISFSPMNFLVPANFLPFGNGDTNTPISDDGSSSAIILQHPFKYFGRTHSQVFVNNDGHLTFIQSLSSYIPYVNVRKDIIFPLWTDIDVRSGGTISYRQDTSSAVLAQVTAAVRQQFPNLPFIATSAFVVTWDNVPYYSGEGVVTFQVVLAYNAHRSFILFNYGDSAPTRQLWSAGYDTVDSASSFRLSVRSPSELSSSSNINMNGRWIFHVDGSPDLPTIFLPFGNGEIVNPFSDDGSSDVISLQHPFKYFGRTHSQIFVNNNGHLTFTEPLSSYSPNMNSGRDIIAPLWTHLDNSRGGTISYREETSRAVLARVSTVINQYFPNLVRPFTATSGFVATWDSVPYYSGEGVATFQVVLVSSADHSFTLFNYGNIAETNQLWQALYDTVDSTHSSSVSLLTASQLSSTSNVNNNGRWGFHVYDVCDSLGCTGNEVCSYRRGYGCGCLEGQRPHPETFDAMQICASSTGTMSLSRCQLFEREISPELLHLNDLNCRGAAENGRVLFHFDNEGHVCGTNLTSNNTHFIYQNSIHSNLPTGVISRQEWINIVFSCAYPLIQTLSMPMGINAVQSVVSVDLPGQGTYQIRMIPYHDAQFTSPFQGNVEVQVNQRMYVAVEVEGVDRSQIATVLDNCWATPVNDSEYQIRWNLIVRECPNPDDGTVEVLQNGNNVTSRFSFRMFTFTGVSDRIFLHCQVHLCLLQNGRCIQSCDPGNRRRRRRSLDFHHSAAITMGF